MGQFNRFYRSNLQNPAVHIAVSKKWTQTGPSRTEFSNNNVVRKLDLDI